MLRAHLIRLLRRQLPLSGESVKEGVIPHVPSYKQWHRKPLLACGAMHCCDRIRAINLNLKVKQLTIEKTESNGLLETFIETEQEKYEAKNGIACNYTPFCFVARIDDIVVGAINGATFFAEIYIDELVVTEAHRRKGIGRKLIETVLEYYKDCGFRNINCCTNEFQAPGFYEKCGFELEFVRRNKDNPKLSKYFYIKYLA